MVIKLNAKPLNKMLPKTRAYVKIYDGQTEGIYFLIEFDGLYIKR